MPNLAVLDLSSNQLVGEPGYWIAAAVAPAVPAVPTAPAHRWPFPSPGATLLAWPPPAALMPSRQLEESSAGLCCCGLHLNQICSEFKTLEWRCCAGKLPEKWPRMFPNLEGLMLHHNDLFSYSSEEDPLLGRPAGLPPEWTQPYAPAGFPSLLSLVLYPGNSYICNLPIVEGFSQQGYEDVNPGMPAGCRPLSSHQPILHAALSILLK